jgi:NitT/TauT family transport system substrate-binding protein
MNRRQLGFGLLALPALVRSAAAEVGEVRLGKQHGLATLPQVVMEAGHLVERHAARLGLPSLQVAWRTLSGPGEVADRLLSGEIHIGAVATPALALLWDRTARLARPVRALCAVQSMPYVLVTRNPAVASIADLTAEDRIALPGVKISGQALALQMAAARLWGTDQFDRLDSLTVSMAQPEAAAAIIAGQAVISSHFTVAPFHHAELAAGMRQVLRSYDTVGGRHTNGIAITTATFYQQSPRVCAAVLAAHDEANEFIRKHPRDAATIYLAQSRDQHFTVGEIETMLADPEIAYTTAPAKVMQLIAFMHQVGRIRTMPESWKDLFLPDAHGLEGS